MDSWHAKLQSDLLSAAALALGVYFRVSPPSETLPLKWTFFQQRPGSWDTQERALGTDGIYHDCGRTHREGAGILCIVLLRLHC